MSLNNWTNKLQILPLEQDEIKKVFHHMLIHCKVTKFWEINFKILSHILVTPVVLSAILHMHNLDLVKCYWCGERTNIDHILLHCMFTRNLHSLVSRTIGQVRNDSWIFGGAGSAQDQIIWVINFAIYRSHLQACHGIYNPPLQLFLSEALHFEKMFPLLHDFALQLSCT